MLATKRSAGVTPEVNLRNPLHAGEKTHKQGIHPGFETQGRHHQKFKTGVSVAPQKELVSSKKFKKKKLKKTLGKAPIVSRSIVNIVLAPMYAKLKFLAT